MIDSVKPTVAERLREARARIFETAAEAARALDMKPVTVRAHESGQNQVSYYDLEKYARRYGVDVGWLVTGKGSGEPQYDVHAQLGEHVEVLTIVEDGVWLPDSEDYHHFPVRAPITSTGDPEFAAYTDPRFPAVMIEAFKVATAREDGAYINGTIAFAIASWAIGYRPGDHVICVVEDRRRAICQWTIRRAELRGKKIMLAAVLSDGAPLSNEQSDLDVIVHVVAVVIGTITRRPVNELPADFYSSSHAKEADKKMLEKPRPKR